MKREFNGHIAYCPTQQECAMGLNSAVIKPETRVNKAEAAGQHLEQPNQNLMIFEQVEGSIEIALKLLKQLEVSNTMQETDKQGCIWTLDGWKKHNLKHLKEGF